MSERERPWSFPVTIDEIPETGRHFDLEADERARAAIAALAGVAGVPLLRAGFDVARHGSGGLEVSGTVTAQVDQICVVTLEPTRSTIEEPVALTFAPPPHGEVGRVEVPIDGDGPEPLVNGTVDLGGIAAEFLVLAIDPYPRRPGAVFEAPAVPDDPSAHPFAALAALKGQKPAGGG
jgi:uncharacterized metal-binding protein YceD (DUF177 family)